MATRRALVPVAFLLVVFLAAAVLAGCEVEPSKVIEEGQQVERQADTAVREANLRMIDAAVRMYYAEEGDYPSTIGQLVPGYFGKVPTDPAGGTYYLVKEGGAVKAAVK
ncbi:MAG: hypothetical protein KKF66_05470 [Actinobacteria bacterium]|nr:hypothetical protein [Actinomycetota bacterium]